MSKTTNRNSPEVRERAVRVVLENQGGHGSRWGAAVSIAAKIGCSAQTLNVWLKKTEVDSAKRAALPGEAADRHRALERENRERGQARDILHMASAFPAQVELDRPFTK